MVMEQASLLSAQDPPLSALKERLNDTLEIEKLLHKSLLESLLICNDLEQSIYPALEAEGAAKRDERGGWRIAHITLAQLTEVSRIAQKLVAAKVAMAAAVRDGVIVQGAVEQALLGTSLDAD